MPSDKLSDKRFAVLIDADNVAPKFIGSIMDELSNEGTLTYKRIYGDWTRPDLGPWKKVLLDYSITPIQQYSYTSGKNATDSAMIIDAMDILYADKVEGFCIVSSDSDFTRLAARLREAGVYVIGMGEKKTPKPFIAACDKFKYLEVIAELGSSAARSKAKKSGDSAAQGQQQQGKKNGQKHEKQQKQPQIAAAAAEPIPQIQHEPEPPALSDDGYAPTTLDGIAKVIMAIVDEISDEEGWAALSHIGNILLKRYPDFDVRNYGFLKLTRLIKSCNCFEINADKTRDGNKIVSVRIAD